MRSYAFAPISAREYPTIRLLDNPYIWGGVRFCVNVSEKPYSTELVMALKEHGIEWIYCPVSENDGAQRRDAILNALPKMLLAYESGLKQVVHCDFGNNRSRSFVEDLYYQISMNTSPTSTRENSITWLTTAGKGIFLPYQKQRNY